MSPALYGGFVLQCFERGNAVELHNGIISDFYPGLPHTKIALQAGAPTAH